MPLGLRTAVASTCAALWRVVLTPVDTLKTTMQVQGPAGYALLLAKVKKNGVDVLWSGAAANFAANFVGNYPWYVTFNTLVGIWLPPNPKPRPKPKPNPSPNPTQVRDLQHPRGHMAPPRSRGRSARQADSPCGVGARRHVRVRLHRQLDPGAQDGAPDVGGRGEL